MSQKNISSKEKAWDEIASAISADFITNCITNILQVKYRHIMNKKLKSCLRAQCLKNIVYFIN